MRKYRNFWNSSHFHKQQTKKLLKLSRIYEYSDIPTHPYPPTDRDDAFNLQIQWWSKSWIYKLIIIPFAVYSRRGVLAGCQPKFANLLMLLCADLLRILANIILYKQKLYFLQSQEVSWQKNVFILVLWQTSYLNKMFSIWIVNYNFPNQFCAFNISCFYC